MSNTYFRFKQFTVHQDQCAMKVCTDACLFGAWLAKKIVAEKWNLQNVLDIGTGTGLLSLMVAQTQAAQSIEAIDINPEAAAQSAVNFASSPWHEQLKAIEDDVNHFETAQQYDLIISNPPFFENDLRSLDEGKNLALHSIALSLEELVKNVTRLLKKEGRFAVLLPFHRANDFIKMTAQQGLFLAEKMLVRQTEKHPHFRTVMLFTRKQQTATEHEITIKINGNYSAEFIRLLRPFYLYL